MYRVQIRCRDTSRRVHIPVQGSRLHVMCFSSTGTTTTVVTKMVICNKTYLRPSPHQCSSRSYIDGTINTAVLFTFYRLRTAVPVDILFAFAKNVILLVGSLDLVFHPNSKYNILLCLVYDVLLKQEYHQLWVTKNVSDRTEVVCNSFRFPRKGRKPMPYAIAERVGER